MKKTIFCILFLVFSALASQEKFSREFKVQTDNDLYISTEEDKYYTNGLFLSYKYLSTKKSEKLHKKIIQWSLGHEMYSPFKAVLRDPEAHDRPFAAYLFGSLSYHFIFKNNQNLKTTLQFGVLGKNAFGRELQDFVHDIYGYKRAIGWAYQIKSALGLNLNLAYLKRIGINSTKRIDLNFAANSRVGSIYTDVSLGFLSRIGLTTLAPMANTIAFETNLNNQNTNFFNAVESFIYVKPLWHNVLYDATLEGSFLNPGSPITKKPIPMKLEVEVGIQFTAQRFNFGYAINFQTNKTDQLQKPNGNKFGRILVSYVIR